ncbi:MAG TPA: filamentous hemagglutinin N-terminal domain-containing protein, partial [Rhizomicrobium sp.]|nr:filamentous hemagglutinin N-terminal domain-containing protein [Rhizomicrobium sp.]
MAPTYTGLGTSNLQVNLNQPRTIIDWSTYNIGQGQTTSYIFGANNNNWIVLNRVNSGSATINGTLQGCLADCTTFGGNIWIYAADGVVIGNNAVVNTGGFLATTSPLSMTDSAFATGTGNSFSFGSANAGTSVQVLSGAQITSSGGTLAFIAPQVSTQSGSTITAPNGSGSVLYGAATSYTLQFAPDADNDFDLVTFDVPAAGSSGGSTSTTPINIQGATKAGNVYVAAVTQSSVANAMISIGGEHTATQASSVGGDIVLSAGGGIENGQAAAPSGGAGGQVSATVSGNLQASNQIALNTTGNLTVSGAVNANNATGAGGTVTATGANVEVAGTANISANGTSGGTILIGGDVHGGINPSEDFSSQPIADAQTTSIDSGAQISANGSDGAGGNVVVWSNNQTNFNGSISATGFLSGGFAEVSSHLTLDFNGTVNLKSSTPGKDGTLLLDPSDLTISTTDNNTNSSTVGSTTTDTPNGLGGSSIANTTLESELANANVVITTVGTPDVAGEHGDIFVSAPVSWSSGNTLTLDAYHSVFIGAAITANTGSGGSFTAIANDGGTGGVIEFDTGGSVTTKGAQTYNGPVSLTADTTLSTTNSPVDFKSTVDGGYNLTVDAEIGAVTFGGYVGSITPLASLTVTGPTNLNAGDNGGATNTVTTNGSGQTYNSAVTLGADAKLVDTGAGNITFGSTVDAATVNSYGLTVSTGGLMTFGGAVGGGTALTSVTTEGGGSTDINGGAVTTAGDGQDYTGPVVLGASTTLTDTGAGNITFGSTVDAAAVNSYGLTVSTGGLMTFTGAVGSIDALASLTTEGGGSTDLDAGDNGGATPTVSTTGVQNYYGPVVLAADTTLQGQEANFTSTVDDATAGTAKLVVQGSAVFNGNVGGSAELSSLSVSGATELYPAGPSITIATTGDQTYTGAVNLGASTLGGYTFIGGGLVDFQGGLTVPGPGNFAMEVSGNAEFDATVGSAAYPLSSLEVTGTAVLKAGNVFTNGGQFYDGAVTVASDTTLTDTGASNITFSSTVDAASARGAGLTVSTAGLTTFTGAVGSVYPLASLTTEGGGSTDLNGGAVTTSAMTTTGQDYEGPVVLGANTTLTDTGGGNITFDSTVGGAYGLTVSTGGLMTFGGMVGGGVGMQLTSLTTEGGGSTDINGGAVMTSATTTTGQDYEGPVVLGANTTLTDTGGGNITFDSTVGGAYGLTVST